MLQTPVRRPVQARSRRMSAITLLLPVLTGIFLAVAFHRMLFLAFAVISPVMMIGNTWDDRRRRRRETGEEEARFAAELADFTARLGEARAKAVVHHYRDVPSVAELVSRADRGAVSLWERRPTDEDFSTLAIGYGPVEWSVPVSGSAGETEVAAVLEAHRRLPCGPVTMALTATRSAGIVGPSERRRGVARALIAQAAALHGPADLRIGVVTEEPAAWDWSKWLPHTCLNGGTEIRMLAAADQDVHHLLGFLRAAPAEGEPGPLTLLVLDHRHLDDEQRRMITDILAGTGRPVAGVVLATEVAGLPSRCTHVVEIDGDDAALWQPGRADDVSRFRPIEIDPRVAARLARRLTHLDDPEATRAGAGLPRSVGLLDLLALDDPSPTAILDRWSASRPPRLSTPVGATEGGALTLDLDTDGPHGLLAGTTGSGKSEFLRSLVAGLAAGADPDHLTFVLIDYKGGAAFDACADLPQVVGLVTDLDEQLGRRALVCLEAELHHREGRLREAGVSSIGELWATDPAEPMPRLVVVVDEFATLAAELPDFMDALVDIAQRGRSLGVHMILATQRPAGIVKDSIRANTNLRVSLRVQTPADSNDVLGTSDAARISRSHPGRGLVRLGPGELIPFQTAFVSGRGEADLPRLRITPFVFAMRQPEPPPTGTRPADDQPTDLVRLVGAIADAAACAGHRPPRRPWPDPLPDALAPDALDLDPPERLAAPIGLVDLPHQQRQDTWSWQPAVDGNLLLAGMPSSGPGTAAVAAMAGLARRLGPDDLHLYGIDHGNGELGRLDDLPHTGAIVRGDSVDRQIRLIEFLRREIEHRRATGRTTPAIVFAIDGLAGFRTAFDDPELVVYRDRLQEVVAGGPTRGIFTVLTADQARSVPGALAGAMPHRLVFALADRLDYSTFGLSTPPPPPGTGRAVEVRNGHHVQIVTDASASVVAAAEWPAPLIEPDPIATLSGEVGLADLLDAGQITEGHWQLPIAIDDRLLAPVTVPFFDGDHFLVAGPRRSGRSTALLTFGTTARKLDGSLTIAAVAGPRSPLGGHPAIDLLLTPAELGRLTGLAGPALVLVDDADDVDDPDGVLAGMLAAAGTGIHVVAAGRADVIRGLPRHWTRVFRSARRGLVLQPAESADGDVVGARLPRTAPITVAGRGFLVDGTATLVQVAR